MNLAIDIGNSYIKIGGFVKGELVTPVSRLQRIELDRVVNELQPEKIILSSVAVEISKISFPFIDKYSSLILTHKTPLPFTLDYKTPETLGVDRIAAVAGAQVINPGRASMVIDAGTCITYDIINGKGLFLGGIISPGIKLRFKSMHDNTGKLPLINFEKTIPELPLIGKSTVEAMKSGVINGIKGEMESFINLYSGLFPELKVIMCGGEAKFFESSLKASIFAVPDLVLIGLNRILEYNG